MAEEQETQQTEDPSETGEAQDEGGKEGDEATNQGEEDGGEGYGEEKESDDDDLTFMDPNEIPKELKPAFKKMQASFTRAMQSSKGATSKAELYDSLTADPSAALQFFANKAGMKVENGKVVRDSEDDGEPPTETEKLLEKIVQKALAPHLQKMESAQAKKQYEDTVSYLNDHHPDWLRYEKTMVKLVQDHPTLKTDPKRLYKMAVQEQGGTINRPKGDATKKTGSEKVVTKTSSGRADKMESKPSKTVREAMDKAIEQLGG